MKTIVFIAIALLQVNTAMAAKSVTLDSDKHGVCHRYVDNGRKAVELNLKIGESRKAIGRIFTCIDPVPEELITSTGACNQVVPFSAKTGGQDFDGKSLGLKHGEKKLFKGYWYTCTDPTIAKQEEILAEDLNKGNIVTKN